MLFGIGSFHPLEAVSLSNVLTLLGVLLLLIACASLCVATYNVTLHPLAKFPGPIYAGASRAWYCSQLLLGRLPFEVHKLHEKHGDTVRIAPNEISFPTPDAWNDIYGHRPGKNEIMKDPTFYNTTTSEAGGILNANRTRHGYLRKQLSHGFSEKALRQQEHVVLEHANTCLDGLRTAGRDGTIPVDMNKWYNFFTFDMTSHLVFGDSFNCMENSNYHPWVALIFDSIRAGAYLRTAKYWPGLTSLVRRFLPGDLMKRFDENRKLARTKAAARKEINDGRLDLINGLLKDGTVVSDTEYRSTCQTFIFAGSETTATLLSSMTYFLLVNPRKLEKLVTEIRSTFESPSAINSISVNTLAYLTATISEGLGYFPPVADSFPRNTSDYSEIVCNKVIPPHTVLRVTPWAVSRSPQNFTRPNEFIPERWLDGNKEFATNKTWGINPFSTGPRNCIGRNLAYLATRLLMSLLLWHFDLQLAPDSVDWFERNKNYVLWDKPDLNVILKPRVVL